MRNEASSAGFYTSPWGKHARLQFLTVKDLVTGQGAGPPADPSERHIQACAQGAARQAEAKRLDFDSSGDEDQEEQPF